VGAAAENENSRKEEIVKEEAKKNPIELVSTSNTIVNMDCEVLKSRTNLQLYALKKHVINLTIKFLSFLYFIALINITCKITLSFLHLFFLTFNL